MTADSRFHAGAQLDRAPGPKYVETLHFAELLPKAPLPRPETIAGWRQRLPEGFRVALVTPRSAVASGGGALRFDDELEAGLAWFLAAGAALDASVLVVQTESDTTTGQRDRDLLSAYFERLPRDRPVVWSPRGLWEPDEARRFAQRLEVACAFDPIEDPLPDGELLYARLRALGARQRLGDDLLEQIVDLLAESEASEIYVAIESQRSFREATRLSELAAAAG